MGVASDHASRAPVAGAMLEAYFELVSSRDICDRGGDVLRRSRIRLRSLTGGGAGDRCVPLVVEQRIPLGNAAVIGSGRTHARWRRASRLNHLSLIRVDVLMV